MKHRKRGSTSGTDYLSEEERQATHEYLRANKITQAEFARRIGVSPAAVSRAISGGRGTSKRNAEAWRAELMKAGLIELSKPAIRSVNTRTLLGQGWTEDKIFDAVAALDRDAIGDDTPAPPATRGMFCFKYRTYPLTSRLLLCANSMIGYCGVVPLTDAADRAIQGGKPLGNVLTRGCLAPLEIGGVFIAYVTGIVVRKGFESHRRIAVRSLIEMLLDLADDGVYFERFLTHAWTDDGEKICDALEMKKIGGKTADGQLYVRETFPLPSRYLVSGTPLVGVYEKARLKGLFPPPEDG